MSTRNPRLNFKFQPLYVIILNLGTFLWIKKLYFIIFLFFWTENIHFVSFSPRVVFNALYSTQDNVLVAAPTGSGKTICAEFAILKLFSDVPKAAKAVYVTPYASLAKQVSKNISVM